MVAKALTVKLVEQAKPEEARYEIWDKIQPGLGLRISEAGIKSWVLLYRLAGKQRRMTLGRFPTIDLKAARQIARDALIQVQGGIDPVEQREEAETKAAAERANTFAHLAARYLAEHIEKKGRRWPEVERILNKDVLPAIGSKPMKAVSKRDVQAVVDAVVARGAEVQANRTLDVMNRVLNWAVKKELIDVSPARNIEPPGTETDRARWLEGSELRKVWQACGGMGYPFGPLIRLLILTGQRRDEVAHMRWAEIDGETWTLPAERAKNGKEHEVHLSALALAELANLPRFDGCDLVFTTNRKTPVSGFSKAKARLDAEVLKMGQDDAERAGTDPSKVKPLPAWVLHDTRRSVVSHMARLGIAPHIADKILNHQSGTIKGVAAVYQRHAFLDERRDALNLWSRYVESLVSPALDNVIMLRAAGEP